MIRAADQFDAPARNTAARFHAEEAALIGTDVVISLANLHAPDAPDDEQIYETAVEAFHFAALALEDGGL
jgi:hypothetical protein